MLYYHLYYYCYYVLPMHHCSIHMNTVIIMIITMVVIMISIIMTINIIIIITLIRISMVISIIIISVHLRRIMFNLCIMMMMIIIITRTGAKYYKPESTQVNIHWQTPQTIHWKTLGCGSWPFGGTLRGNWRTGFPAPSFVRLQRLLPEIPREVPNQGVEFHSFVHITQFTISQLTHYTVDNFTVSELLLTAVP